MNVPPSSLRAPTAVATYEIDPVKGSRFVAVASPIASSSAARDYLTQCQRAMPDAAHHCWAYRLNEKIAHASDAGEPAGSAGRPILSQIMGAGFVATIVVVVRYYGGIKLGVGGLVRAYSAAARQVLSPS